MPKFKRIARGSPFLTNQRSGRARDGDGGAKGREAAPRQDSSDFRGRCACVLHECVALSESLLAAFPRSRSGATTTCWPWKSATTRDGRCLKSYGMCQVYLIADTIVNSIETVSVFARSGPYIVIVVGIRFPSAKGNFIRHHLPYFIIRYL